MPLFRRQASESEPPQRSGRLRRAWRGLRRGTQRYRFLTDVLGALVIVAVLVGGLAAATGGVWPPVVVVESGSMMHSSFETPYGRIGTIDVGDVVFIRAVDDPRDIATFAEGGDLRYGRPGTVIAYAQDGDHSNVTIIHRAIAYVEVERLPDLSTRYHLQWVDGEVRTFGSAGIYFPPLGFSESFGFTPANGYKPAYSGYLTKGDNAFTNPGADQAIGISRIVEPAWIVGEVYGEVPWIGLGKLALQSGKTNPNVPGWERVGNAFAPLELWSMFFLVLAVVVLVPLSIDTWRAWRQDRELRALERIARERDRETRRTRFEPAAPRPATQAQPGPKPPGRQGP